MKFLILAVIFLGGMVRAAAPHKFETCSDFYMTATVNENQKFTALMKLHWQYEMQTFPEWATYAGYPDSNDRWTDDSLAAIAKRKKETHCKLESLKSIIYNKLSTAQKVNYDLLLQSYQEQIESQSFGGEYLALNHMDGVHTAIPDVLGASPKNTKKDVQNMLTRLESASTKIDQHMALLREGLKRGVTSPQIILQKVPPQFDPLLTKNMKDSGLYSAFAELPDAFTASEKTEIQNKALSIIENKLYPKMNELKKFLIDEYTPKARQTIAFTDLPQGQDWYKFNVKTQTTTSFTPDFIHQLGLDEVARIEKEMLKIKDQVGFKGSLADFNKYLLSDKKFYFDNTKDLLMAYRDAAKRIDAELPKIFGRLPRLTYGVREIPAYKAASSPAAYYTLGSLEAGRPGYFEANTTDLKGRPKWGIEVLTLHEAVPGHHLQLSLAAELGELPDFRKFGGYNAYSEGWGLYAESLGDQLSMYQDPYSKYGQYSYEIWRAVRLVVDTGMHAKGWSREKALTYFMDHVPKSKTECEVEIDRYIAWPGQALGYKIGQLKFLELRTKAQIELKDKFDIRKFHDEILSYGSVPMNVLEKLFNIWLNKQIKQERLTKPVGLMSIANDFV